MPDAVQRERQRRELDREIVLCEHPLRDVAGWREDKVFRLRVPGRKDLCAAQRKRCLSAFKPLKIGLVEEPDVLAISPTEKVFAFVHPPRVERAVRSSVE